MNKDLKWFNKSGENDNIVVSSRIRLARNIKNLSFPCSMSADEKNALLKTFKQLSVKMNESGLKLDFFEMEKMEIEKCYCLVDRHLVSPDFIKDRQGKGILLSKDESICVMINEEDHVRIQVLQSGLNLDEALETAMKVDDFLSENFEFAFDENLGFLTECPTNLGTGLRASVMVHLIGLEKLSQIARLASTISKMGLTVRGTFGEGTKATNYYYQISNQVTLGIDENQVVQNLKNITYQIIREEEMAQKRFIQDSDAAEDKINRVLGILKYAKMMSYEEMCVLISDLRLGICQKYLNIEPYILNSLIIDSTNANIVSNHLNKDGEEPKNSKCEKIRCELIKEGLNNY